MVVDLRQAKKVKHLMKDIILIVFFAKLAKADEWMDIYYFASSKETFLRKYLELPNGIPSHDTIQRVFAMVSPEFLTNFQRKWNELLNGNQGEKLKKIFALDGKAQRGNKRGGQQPNHIVSAVDENGFCFSQRLVDEKSNEIKAIPGLQGNTGLIGGNQRQGSYRNNRCHGLPKGRRIKDSAEEGGLCFGAERQPRNAIRRCEVVFRGCGFTQKVCVYANRRKSAFVV